MRPKGLPSCLHFQNGVQVKGECVRHMQHHMQRALRGQCRWILLRVWCVLVACVACLTTSLAVAPAYAAQGEYSIDELSTEITVETNATAHIVERTVVTFQNENQGVVWYLHVPESGESVRISSVRVAAVDDGGAPLTGWTTLQMVDSKPSQQGRDPGDTAAPSLRTKKTRPWYSYNIGDGMVRCYFPLETTSGAVDGETADSGAADSATDPAAANSGVADAADAANSDSAGSGEGASADGVDAGASGETAENADAADTNADASTAAASESSSASEELCHTYAIEVDYTIAHRVRVYRDVAELYWRYVNDSLPSDSSDVNLQIKLPVPEGSDPEAVKNSIQAWGHGPDYGTFSIEGDGTVTYHMDHIASGNYAEAHVISPPAG